MKLLTILILAVIGASQSVYTYQFPAAISSTYQIPSYPLGSLNQNDNLTIVIQLPTGGAMLISSYVLISIMDFANTNTITTFDDSNPSHCNGGTTCTLNWTVTTTANYYLKVYSSNPNTELNSLAMYYLLAYANNVAVLRVTDVLRQHIIKYFYVAQEENITMTISPAGSFRQNYFTLLIMSPASPSGLTVMQSQDLTPVTVSGNIATFTQDLVSGFYAVVAHTNSANTFSITTQSDPYPCPYTNNYTDFFTIFPGCTRDATISQGSGLPCITYDYNSQVCLACMSGYSVSKGICVSSSNCKPRQYYHFGNCYDVSAACGQFDPYTGNCLTCANGSQDQLINGQCITFTNFCSPGFYLVNSRCISNTCGSYSQATGKCLTCVTAAYKLSSSGQCIAVDCGANDMYYSVKSAKCINVPPTCTNFSITYEVCYTCIPGYSLFNGDCTVYSNSNNCQIYNYAANVCTTCNTGYYILNGGCIKNPTCAIGQTLTNGICVLSPVNCNQNQILINSQCTDLPPNCLTLNVYFQCTSCAANFQLISGVCQACNGPNPNFPCLNCPLGMYVDNQGRCQPVNQNCGSYNSANGLCLTCINRQQPVVGTCCPIGQTYLNGVCTVQQSNSYGGSTAGASSNTNSNAGSDTSGNNNNGSNGSNGNNGGNSGSTGSSGSSGPKKYSPYCQTIDPALRICTSCLDGHFFDQSGYCI